MERTYVYVGDVDRALQGQPTFRPTPPTFNQSSRVHFDALRPVLAEHPVILLLAAFDRQYRDVLGAHPDWEVAPGVAVARGPRPPGVAEAEGLPPPLSGPRLGLLVAAVVVLLGAVGGGWSVVLTPASRLDRVALAPAFGIATVVIPGVVTGRLGFAASSAAVQAVVAAVAVAGWVVAVVRWRRARPSRGPGPLLQEPEPRTTSSPEEPSNPRPARPPTP